MSKEIADAVAAVSGAIGEPRKLSRIVFSGRRKGYQPQYQRIDIRPIDLKGKIHLNCVFHDGRTDLTKNLIPNQFDIAAQFESGFANVLIETESERIEIRITKKGEALLHRSVIETSPQSLAHDREKSRLLPASDPLFIELGISDKSGHLIPNKSDKYIQVDQFLRILEPLIRDHEGPLSIVDLGCGHAYLTFAAYRFARTNGIDTRLVGVDTRADFIKRNNAIAARLEIDSDVSFTTAAIADFPIQRCDIAIALHACDTATDDAIAWAIHSNAKIILMAPCCHHDLNKQIGSTSTPDQLHILTRHGILKERFADNLTDAIRADALTLLGYRSDVIEFVAGEHTNRNLLIRAEKTGRSATKADFEELDALVGQWQIEPKVLSLLEPELEAQRARLTLS